MEEFQTIETVVEEVVQTVDLTTVENLIGRNLHTLQQIYVAQLFVIGCAAAFVVCIIIYSLIKKCY